MSTTVDSARLEVTSNADEYAGDVKKIENATKGMGANLGRSALEASRALEDLQYGVGGVVNNIPGLVSALGGGAGAMAAFSVGAVAIAQVSKNWSSLLEVFERKTTIPKAADDVSGLKDELEKARDRMKELGEKSTVTVGQLAEYNTLRERTATIERTIAEQMERQKDVETLRKIDPDKERSDARAKDLQKNAIGKDFTSDDLINSVQEALRVSLTAQRRELGRAAIASSPDDPNRMLLNEQAWRITNRLDAKGGLKAEAETLVTQAVEHGKEGAFNEIRELMRKAPEKFIPEQERAFANAVAVETPTEKAARDARNRDKEKRNNELLKAHADRQAANLQNVASDAKTTMTDAEGLLNYFDRLGDGLNKDAKREGKAGKDKSVEAAKKVIDEREKSLRETSIDEDAAVLAAQMQAAGGMVDKNGRVRRMTREQQEAHVRDVVSRRITAANPDLDRFSAGTLTNRFATGAYRQVDDATEQARASIAQMAKEANVNLEGRQITNMALQQALAALTAVANQLRQEQAKTQELGRGFANVNQFLQQPFPTNLPGGHH